MVSLVGDFGKTAQRLSRNPLGIIALFIVLVYGIAALVLGVSSEHLEAGERLPVVWFLVIYPFFVLGIFYWLVARHHTKLYAPIDFPDKEGFFRALSPTEQKQRLDEEVQSLEAEAIQVNKHKTLAVETESQRILKAISIRHASVLAEALAFREIESEFGVSVHRQVAVGLDHKVDGLFLHYGKPVAVEIKLGYGRAFWPEMLQREIERFGHIDQTTKPAPSFLLAIVVEGLTEEQMKVETQRTVELLRSSSLTIETRVYDFDILKEKYGLTENSKSREGLSETCQ